MHPYTSVSFLLMFLIMIVFISLEIPLSDASNQYANCSEPVNCGNLEDIKYPFWGVNRAADCGMPGFELTCQENVPKFSMASQSYRVLDVYPERETLRIAREDYWDNACPDLLYNTTLNFTLFDYQSGLRNLTLLYDCSSAFTLNLPIPNIFSQENCFINESKTPINLFYATTNISLNPLIGSCRNRVDLPVLERNAQALEQRSKRLVDAIKEGFDVRWLEDTVRDCNACEDEDSKGVCGYNRTLSRFHCFCPDLTISNTTCSIVSQQESNSTKKPVVIGAVVGGAAVICIVVGFSSFFLLKRRKQAVAMSQNKDISTPTSSQGLPVTTISKFYRSTPDNSMSSDPEKGSNYFGVMVFRYSELAEATNSFDPSRELGDGGFGTVYYGELSDGRAVAVKRLYENNCKRVAQFMNEVEIITRLKHPNLVKLYGCTSRRSRELILVYEYIPNGTVADHLHGKQEKSGLLPWHLRLSIAIETAAALAYLHASDIIHRDVKTNNILLDNDFTVKVADFGLSRLFPNDVTHVSTAPQGTPGYVDPEYYKCYQLTGKSDVYSFGVVLVELISSRQAVDISRHRQDVNLANMAINKIQTHALHELVDLSLGFESDFSVRRTMTLVAELAFRCLQEERDMRPSMEEVYEVLKGIKNEELNAKVMDINGEDDVGLLKSATWSLSPDSDKWISSSITSGKWTRIRSM